METIRGLKTGGSSICRAKPENVGKYRCNHTHGNEVKVEKSGRTKFVNIDKIDKKNKETQAQMNSKVKSYISKTSNSLTKKEKSNVLKHLRNK